MNAVATVHTPRISADLSPVVPTAGRDRSIETPSDARSVSVQSSDALSDAPVDRLACLFRHWTWANEARMRFERELTDGWDYDEDLIADHPFGAYYQWCALLCGLTEAALERRLLPASQLDTLRTDLETSLPWLRACRQLLVVIPASLEEHPRVVDFLRDHNTLSRLHRVHQAFGEVLIEEQRSRELDLLDPEGDVCAPGASAWATASRERRA